LIYNNITILNGNVRHHLVTDSQLASSSLNFFIVQLLKGGFR